MCWKAVVINRQKNILVTSICIWEVQRAQRWKRGPGTSPGIGGLGVEVPQKVKLFR